MAQPNRGRRPRGRNNNSNQNRQKFVNKNQAFDSSGPQGRVRGNAQQIFEKYQALARDAQAANEHTLAEAHFQHAEHYLRLHNEVMEQIEAQRVEKAKRDEERSSERTSERPQRSPRARAEADRADGSDEQMAEQPEPIEVVQESDPSDAPQPSLLVEEESVA